ncbi:hypothetical protein HEP84_48385 [Streptomyces sp. RLB1-33]|nr:hypothetical protein [Streptomyces sp. RLB1-33]QIY75679.1 hypothetical protein HEP84_48385 [Streptomyces sp. RLB1-33]
MTTAESGAFSSAALEEYLSLIAELLAQPFPEKNLDDVTGYSGPEHRVRVLRASRDFGMPRTGRLGARLTPT